MVPEAPEHGLELDFSDDESETESSVSSENESVSVPELEPGVIDGIAPEDCQEGYLITQPASTISATSTFGQPES